MAYNQNFPCRGKMRREKLKELYYIKPVMHISLLKGQKLRSAAEDTITKEYYSFEYQSKHLSSDKGTFICGIYVAKHFLEILKISPIPLFCPFKSYIKTASVNNNTACDEKDGTKWHPLAKELFDVVNIIVMLWTACDPPLTEILQRIRKYYFEEPKLSDIKAVNTIMKKSSGSIYEIIEDLKKEHDMKYFSFLEIASFLKEKNIKDNITIAKYKKA